MCVNAVAILKFIKKMGWIPTDPVIGRNKPGEVHVQDARTQQRTRVDLVCKDPRDTTRPWRIIEIKTTTCTLKTHLATYKKTRVGASVARAKKGYGRNNKQGMDKNNSRNKKSMVKTRKTYFGSSVTRTGKVNTRKNRDLEQARIAGRLFCNQFNVSPSSIKSVVLVACRGTVTKHV